MLHVIKLNDYHSHIAELRQTFMTIPRKIHYCWFGGKPLPRSAKKCIRSWKKFFPDYEIIRWDESNFNVESCPYTQEAYKNKKYAFVSDFARFFILFNQGGLYFDTDVEVIRPLQDIVDKGPFMGCEHPSLPDEKPEELGVNPGLGMGAEKNNGFCKEMVDLYFRLHFINKDNSINQTTIVTYTSDLLAKKGLKNTNVIQEVNGFKIYPVDYFCPISTEDGKLRITGNTRTIHLFDQSWQSPWRKLGRKIVLSIGGVRLKKAIKKVIFK